MRAWRARGGYSGCTRSIKFPSIIRETRCAWLTGTGGGAKLEVEFAIELMIGLSLQRLLVPPGTPSCLTSSCGWESSDGMTFISREVCLGTTSAALAGLLGRLVKR